MTGLLYWDRHNVLEFISFGKNRTVRVIGISIGSHGLCTGFLASYYWHFGPIASST